MCVSHLTKAGGTEAMLRVMGSLGFVAAARGAYLVAKDPDDPGRRLFLPMKNNLAEDHGGLAFRVKGRDLGRGIVTSCVEWDSEPVTMTADEAIAPVAVEEDRGVLEDAQEFLAGLLADGPLPSRQIRADADGAGHAWATIRRAQKALGIQAIKEGGRFGNSKQQWMWRMPESQKALKIPEDAHTKSLSAFCNLEHLQQSSGGDPTVHTTPPNGADHQAIDEIRAWFVRIGETDPETITTVLEACARDPDTMTGYLRSAREGSHE
ncbi:MAG: hypothetical protein ACREXM_18515 [Gammaproteobacteria bacterium]